MLKVRKLARSAPVASSGLAAVNIAFDIDSQQQDNWCWAAVSSSVSFFYLPISKWTQCEVATAEVGGKCCAKPAPCNVAWSLESALNRTTNLASVTAKPMAVTAIQTELAAKRPVCARVEWKSKSAHFLGIKGHYQDKGLDILVLTDPIYGESTMSALDLGNGAYQGDGKWTHTYTTKA
jgi:Papain-like cysteine protease AvrRpt2